MKEVKIIVEDVHKYYILYHNIVGIKNVLFNLPRTLKQLRDNKFHAIRGISFKIYEGETVGIIGRNGAGKSTLLGLIAGVIRPSSGKIFVNGRVVPLLELGAGFHPDLTGEENIVLNGILLGLTKREILAIKQDIVEFSELKSFIYQPVRTYSSGMLARLGFSVAINIDADIFLIDEIIAVGDIEFQKKCYEKLFEFKKKKKTIVIVSHDLEAIKRLCDRVIMLDEGKIAVENKWL